MVTWGRDHDSPGFCFPDVRSYDMITGKIFGPNGRCLCRDTKTDSGLVPLTLRDLGLKRNAEEKARTFRSLLRPGGSSDLTEDSTLPTDSSAECGTLPSLNSADYCKFQVIDDRTPANSSLTLAKDIPRKYRQWYLGNGPFPFPPTSALLGACPEAVSEAEGRYSCQQAKVPRGKQALVDHLLNLCKIARLKLRETSSASDPRRGGSSGEEVAAGARRSEAASVAAPPVPARPSGGDLGSSAKSGSRGSDGDVAMEDAPPARPGDAMDDDGGSAATVVYLKTVASDGHRPRDSSNYTYNLRMLKETWAPVEWPRDFLQRHPRNGHTQATLVSQVHVIPQRNSILWIPTHDSGIPVYYGVAGICMYSGRLHSARGLALNNLDGSPLLWDRLEDVPGHPLFHEVEAEENPDGTLTVPGVSSASTTESYADVAVHFIGDTLTAVQLLVPPCAAYHCETGRLLDGDYRVLFDKQGVPLFLENVGLGFHSDEVAEEHGVVRAYDNALLYERRSTFAIGEPMTDLFMLENCAAHNGMRDGRVIAPEVAYYNLDSLECYDAGRRRLVDCVGQKILLYDLLLVRSREDPCRDPDLDDVDDLVETDIYLVGPDGFSLKRQFQQDLPEEHNPYLDLALASKAEGRAPLLLPHDVEGLPGDEALQLSSAVLRGVAYSRLKRFREHPALSGETAPMALAGMFFILPCLLSFLDIFFSIF